MSEQSTSESVQLLPESIVEGFEFIYNQKIVKVEFVKDYQDLEGCWKIFKVNEKLDFYVRKGKRGYITKIQDEGSNGNGSRLLIV